MSKIILLSANLPILLVAVYAGIHFYKFEKELRIFSGFLFLSAAIQLPSLLLYLFGLNNMPLLHIYTPLGSLILIYFYREILNPFLAKWILNWLAIIFVVFCIVCSVFFQGIFTFNSIALSVQAVIMTILTLSTFNLQIQENLKTANKAYFSCLKWINSGLFIYFSSNLLLYYFSYYLIQSSVSWFDFRNIWLLHALFSNVMYICFFIGLWKRLKS